MTERRGRSAVVGGALIVGGATSIQWSSAMVTPALHAIGPAAASGYRFLFGALILVAITRPSLKAWTKEQWRASIVFGLAVALMNFCFFQALARIPLGATVTIEFLGPLTVAVIGHRSLRHWAFAALAAVGVVFLGHPGGHLNASGVAFALGAALGWGLYLMAASRMGGVADGFGGLAVSMSMAALITLPFALTSAHLLVAHPTLAARMGLVATMSIVLGFALELQALRNVTPSLAGVMMAFDPAVATLLGYLILSQHPTSFDVIGLVCVVAAGIGVTIDQRDTPTSAIA